MLEKPDALSEWMIFEALSDDELFDGWATNELRGLFFDSILKDNKCMLDRLTVTRKVGDKQHQYLQNGGLELLNQFVEVASLLAGEIVSDPARIPEVFERLIEEKGPPRKKVCHAKSKSKKGKEVEEEGDSLNP